jgi:ankyrin repeat protein
MNYSLDQLPEDAGTLHNIIIDLSRRLQNSTLTIESLQQRLAQTSHTAELYRVQVGELSNALRIETSKNSQLVRNKMRDTESANFENDKKKVTDLQEELRLALIDQAIRGSTRDSNKIIRMRTQLGKLETRQESQHRILMHLSESDNLVEQLALYAQNGDFHACSHLLQRGVSVNEVDSAGYLPIHYAASSGNEDVVRLFLEYGADCSGNITGSNPVATAAAAGNNDIIRLLVEFGASIHDHGPGGAPPVVVACSQGHLHSVEYLLELGASVNAMDSNCNSCLHAAARIMDGPAPLITLLMSLGADVKNVNCKGYTPLHLALNLNNIEAIEAFGGRGKAIEEINSMMNTSSLPLSPVNLKKLQAGLSGKATASSAAAAAASAEVREKISVRASKKLSTKPSIKGKSEHSKEFVAKKVNEFAKIIAAPDLSAPPPDDGKENDVVDDAKSEASSITFRGEDE